LIGLFGFLGGVFTTDILTPCVLGNAPLIPQ